jgi:predicted DNA binding CopG/RHH family protein
MARNRKAVAPPKLTTVTTRLFTDDVEELKRRAAIEFTPWQVSLRLLVRRALRGERKEIAVLSEQPR